MSFWSTLHQGLACRCPKCGKGRLFKDGRFNYDLHENCENCGLDFTKNDAADGPAFILTSIFGIVMVPLALWLDAVANISLLLHIVIWSVLCIGLCLVSLKPLKSYIMLVQFRHRPGDWDENETSQ